MKKDTLPTSNSKPRILWLTQGENPNLPSLRLRVHALLGYLSNEFENSILAAPTCLTKLWKSRNIIKSADIVVLQKELISIAALLFLRQLSKKLIYDFDDAVYARLLPDGSSRASPKRMRRFWAICHACDAIHAGNRILANYALNSGAKNISEIPTAVPTPSPNRKNKDSNDPVKIIGWIGTSVNLVYLENLEKTFIKLTNKGHKFILCIMSDKKPKFSTFTNWKYTPWSEHDEERFLSTIDIGLMPLANNLHTQGKCAYKALQYMSHGKPVVVSDVGVTAEWTKAAGLSVGSSDSFYNKLSILLENPSLCKNLGEQGPKIITNRFTHEEIASRIKKSFNKLLYPHIT